MNENPPRSIPVTPFLIVDVLFLAMAGAILGLSHRPMLWWEDCLMIVCGAVAAWSLTMPFLRQERQQQVQAQSNRLADVATELRQLEQLANHIHAATAQWKGLETQSIQSVERAKELSDSLIAESRAFAEALQKAGDNEKAHLRLEVEKFRRNEGEWLQTVTRILDHVFALFLAAQRSGQRALIEQIALFQDSCRESARRIGLTVTTPRPGDPFDARMHQLRDNAPAPEKSVVSEILACGFSYQGQPIRRALVVVQTPTASLPSQQNDLPLAEEAQP
jgi:molecular chaperone GrpE (heat shock protein)